ncbi:MAG: M15 family metallopeptidase [Oscillospiraceae bacterium]|nr:M15 family metallopeptidase [Oscillospiraceae bacterium]
MSKTKYPIWGIALIFLVFVLGLLLLVRTRAVREESSVLVSPVPTYYVFPSMAVSPSPAVTPKPTPEPDALPRIDVDSWQYVLASAASPIGDYEPPELTMVENGQQFDSRAAVSLQNFIADARAQGLNVCLSSAYRDYYTQQFLYNRKVDQLGGDKEAAARIVLPPGTSEHQLGLCADITDQFYEVKDESLENTAMFQWMLEHCAEYGFILRYPQDKQDITGVMYEPWHFRYVGEEAAQYMVAHNLCLEEFLALYA